MCVMGRLWVVVVLGGVWVCVCGWGGGGLCVAGVEDCGCVRCESMSGSVIALQGSEYYSPALGVTYQYEMLLIA